MAISLTSMICCVVFGCLTLLIFFGKQADNSGDSDSQYCETCVGWLDLSLQILTDLSEILANLTRVSEYSTSDSLFTVDKSWAQNPKYSWD